MFIQLSFPGGLRKYNEDRYYVNHGEQWGDVIKSITGHDFDYIFDSDQLKPFLAAYINNAQVTNLYKKICNDGDTLVLLCAISGG